ncbi:MAG: SEC-C domain-containing protein [Desulfocapsaceae bacterium]|nr:SEC-C domain-containing protein [Desulfocapsaceae bacterium]
MNERTGMNARCPCGSGKETKKCCGDPRNFSNADFQEAMETRGFQIYDYTGPQRITHGLGSAGGEFEHMGTFEGNFSEIEDHPENYILVIYVDIPACLPLEDDEPFPISHKGKNYTMFHHSKKRGEEFYSTLDSNKTPHFSSLEIQGEPFNGNNDSSSTKKESYDLILDILNKINSLQDEKDQLLIDGDFHLSYFILYFPKTNFPKSIPIAKITIIYSKSIDIKSRDFVSNLDKSILKKVLSEKIKIQAFSINQTVPQVTGKTFLEKVFICTHDFSFYCSQHPNSLQKLEEEHLRDLFLILAKSIFTNAEGEPFHYDGKLDFKITNNENKYEFITGEFKWWNKEENIKEAFHQAIRKHATGQEAEIFIIILNKNKNISNVVEKINRSIENESEFVEKYAEKITPPGSRQLFNRYLVNVKGNKIILTIGVTNCYFKKQ